MTTEQPVPPSIPPRGRPTAGQGPASGQGARPAPAPRPTTTPETVAAAASPAAERVPNPGRPAQSAPAPAPAPQPAAAPTDDEEPSGRQDSVLAGSRARAAAAGGAAAGAVRRVVRGATAAAIGATSGSSDAPATTGTGRVPSASHTEGDPAMAATDTAPRSDAAARTAPARAGQPAPQAAAARDSGPRRVRLNLSRVDPWSVMKLSFLLSFAIGIMIVVAAVVVWFALDSLAVFTSVNDMITEIVGQESPIDVLQFLDLSRVVSGAMVVAVVDVVLLTALSTIGAFLYNITAALVGGVNVTLTDE
jgi:hypothetical protein